MQDVHVKFYIKNCHGKSRIQQKEGFLHQQTGLKLQEETFVAN